MSQVPGEYNKIQEADVEFRAAIGVGLFRRLAGTVNKALTDREIAAVGSYKKAFLTESEFQTQMGDTWVLADGRDVSGSDYAILTGNTVIPDCRGMFLRMKDNGAGIDETGDPALGSTENDNVPYHVHSISVSKGDATGNFGYPPASIDVAKGTDRPQGNPPNSGAIVTLLTINNAGGTETRPRCLTLNVFIKINVAV